ncbi:Sugar kinase of the NBD/HSP70 family, may contain an N-terminal HTH domain [Gracilibacillus orientalis]|uniref:Sugar kinase of the NBD/HSP70 family, may contain an N-terminal HTH domain n=1 Tax=Gracilibacillus orientalis TaxID=334253 RepID=A0A1I4IMV6_9BACI|nr:ROK family transcriptional regulator [Gracilibacillus orientalis]SFL55605.1 Sugar kinase of the NBD/HSP70 family, may contain an N-terminal HTH domain [Gracilibacillus orientalis]
MITGDGAYIKKINRSYILTEIFEHHKISRADLSKITGLNKATVSVQVNDLLDETLIYETQEEHNTVGRRPILLSINEKVAYFLGIDLDREYILFNITDLKGNTVNYEKVDLQTDVYEEVVKVIAEHIKKYQLEYADARYGLVHSMIAIHGTVSTDHTIHFIPRYQWRDKDLLGDLKKLGIDNISVENNANLSAYAEKIFNYYKSDNLLNINLSSGIGAGIMINGELHKGFHGHAGEMGHMIIYPKGKPCRCGNEGCWERYASEPIFFENANKRLDAKIENHSDIKRLLNKGNQEVMEELNNWIADLTIGLNNVINLYNPEMIVLNSPILKSYPQALEEMKKHLLSSVSQYRDIVISGLGAKAGVVGACAMGIQDFLELPRLTLSKTNNSIII